MSLPSHRLTRDIVGARAPDATQSQVSGPRIGRYNPAASARTKQAYSSAAADSAARSPSNPASSDRAASASAELSNGPSEPSTRPHPRAATETVSACIPASASTVRAARPSSSDRSRSARNGCANVYDR